MLRPLVAGAVLLATAPALADPPRATPPPPSQNTAPNPPQNTAQSNPIKAAAERTQAALATAPTAKPEDVRTVDALLAALYDVISGPPGTPRDWQRMRSLFHPGAQMLPVSRGKAAGAGLHAAVTTPEEYIAWGTGYFQTHGFYEKELSRQTMGYGDLVQVLSAYETREALDGPSTSRGVNSLQLFNDGTRWWILAISWLDEKSAGVPLPKDFARK
ncbi:nuclear transport factor 2 family protein [Corallococcus sp. M34]|uniref:nuclear transport factor 2 family protein n=1 Tax=Citreicoccus inhibens TaxID=2849499 RepID=UPI001C21EEDB|nr:nuclear transport factor 2 family protein [Citreicoccus inhibens]MBU8898817.1 nuclear transport factor 2 family protein [Citreicoccus inhibens]